ncbi:MAG: hypothetical protein QXM12_02820, partial [Nitrososphaerota archaeon]
MGNELPIDLLLEIRRPSFQFHFGSDGAIGEQRAEDFPHLSMEILQTLELLFRLPPLLMSIDQPCREDQNDGSPDPIHRSPPRFVIRDAAMHPDLQDVPFGEIVVRYHEYGLRWQLGFQNVQSGFQMGGVHVGESLVKDHEPHFPQRLQELGEEKEIQEDPLTSGEGFIVHPVFPHLVRKGEMGL